MNVCQRARCHDQAAVRRACEGRDVALDLAGIAYVDRAHLHTDQWRHGLDGAELTRPGGYGGLPKHGRSRHTGGNLFEQLQPFPAYAVLEQGEPGNIAARPRETVNEAAADRVDSLRK